MTPYLSSKLRNLSFLLMILVVYIHGYNVNLRFTDQGQVDAAYWLQFLQGFISDGVCRVAVPMFFAISGYLFTHSFQQSVSVNNYLILLKKRVSSLFVPYLLVSALGIALVLCLQLIPFSKPYFNNYNLSTTTVRKWLFIWTLSPVPYPLWFIRFLMDYILFFPFLYLYLRLTRLPGLLGLFFLWMCVSYHHLIGFLKAGFSLVTFLFCFISHTPVAIYLTTSKIELEGLFFFSVGIFASLYRINLLYTPGKSSLLAMTTGWLAWIAYRTYLNLETEKDHFAVHYNLVCFTLVGFILFWWLYDLVQPKLSNWKWLKENAAFSIGVFLFHEPFLTILKKLMVRLGSSSDFSLLFTYLVSPALSLFFGLILSKWLFRFLPALYSILTGNRKPA